jgi:hypothetical protein
MKKGGRALLTKNGRPRAFDKKMGGRPWGRTAAGIT